MPSWCCRPTISTTPIRLCQDVRGDGNRARQGDDLRVTRNKRTPGDPDMPSRTSSPTSPAPTRTRRPRRTGAPSSGAAATLADAPAFDHGAKLAGTDGFTLDPIVSLRRRVRVPAGKKVSVIFWTIAAPDRERDRQGRRSLSPPGKLSITNRSRPGPAPRCRCAMSASPRRKPPVPEARPLSDLSRHASARR